MNKIVKICRHGIAIICLFLLFQGCYKDINTESLKDSLPEAPYRLLQFDNVEGMVDLEEHTIMYTISKDTLLSFSPFTIYLGYDAVQIDGVELKNEEVNELGQVVVNRPYQVIAKQDLQADTFNLIFTTLPLIHIMTLEEIQDEPKILSQIEMHYCADGNPDHSPSSFNTFAGIEIRGGSSTKFRKKSYGFELWRDESAKEYAASLLGMRFGEDWILDAMFIDNLRMRNKLSFEIWERLSSIPEEDRRNDVIPGIHCKYVELFLNNRYFGLYCLNEQLDTRLLQFKHNQFELGGVLYKAIDWAKGSTRFEIYNSDPPENTIWEGWELIYPENDYQWAPLAELRSMVVQSDDSTFMSEIGSKFDVSNAIDYYLFINLLLAYDNTGKNTFLARYTNLSRFFLMPWDLEATWGRMWEGSNSETFGIVENHLIHRLIETDTEGFNNEVSSQWDELRNTLFHKDTLISHIDGYYTLLKNNGVIERENARWDLQIGLEEEYLYILDWLEARLRFMDRHFR